MLENFLLKNKIVIFCFSLKQIATYWDKDEVTGSGACYHKCSECDAGIIGAFYRDNGYIIDELGVLDEFRRGNEFHGLWLDGRLVAGMWIHKGNVNIKAPSFYALKKRKAEDVCFDDDTIYSSHNVVDVKYRGNHLYTRLLYEVFQYYREKYDYYVIITGADNQKMICSSLKYGGQIIGYVEIIRLLRVFYLRVRDMLWKRHWTNMENRKGKIQ